MKSNTKQKDSPERQEIGFRAILCANCNDEEVTKEGEWCDSCNLPENSIYT